MGLPVGRVLELSCIQGPGAYGRVVVMQAPAISDIEDMLRQLPPEKLAVVLDFVSYLADRQRESETLARVPETMLASEPVLRRDWDRPEEDEAWRHL